MNSKYAYAFAALMLGLTACSNEDLTSPTESPVVGKTVHVTLTVNRPSDVTRTVVDENDDRLSLYSHWASGDKLLVVNAANVKVGELTIDDDSIRESEGVFSGDAVISTTEEYTLIYLGGKNGEADPYACWEDGTGVNNSVAETDFTLSGAKDDLCRADLMKKEGVQFIVSNDNAYPAKNVTLDAVNAMAHFTLTNLPSVASDATLTVNYGDDITHNISGVSEELYLPMPTGKFVISFNLSNGEDSYTASIKEGSEVTVNPGFYYVDTDNTTGLGKGIAVELKEQKPTLKPNDDSDLIGASFEVNGKKFRFTKGNLKYTISTKTWSLHENQYTYICRGGWTCLDGKVGTGKTQEDIIDLYGFGATGLYDQDSGQTAHVPEFWRMTDSQTYTDAAFYYPTSDLTTNKGNGYSGSYLEKGTKFTNFDWGKAYYLSKRGESVPNSIKPYTSYDWEINNDFDESTEIKERRYFTLSSNDWTSLQTKYYFCGATITDANITINKKVQKDVYGCLIIKVTGSSEKEKTDAVKEFLKNRVTSTTGLRPITSSTYSSFKYSQVKMTVAQFEALEKLGVVFLPEAGHRAPDSFSYTDAYYWTSSTNQDNNSTFFLFDGNSSPSVFKCEGKNRSNGGSVRLVKEVPEDYTDPMVVE